MPLRALPLDTADGTAQALDGHTVRVGGHPRQTLQARLSDEHVMLNGHARRLLRHTAFDDSPVTRVRLAIRTPVALGLPAGATHRQLHQAATAHGLLLCPVATAPYLRIAWPHQAPSEGQVENVGYAPPGALHVLSTPLTPDPSFPRGFYLRVAHGTAWLRGYRCEDHYTFAPHDQLAFRMPPGTR